MVSVTMQRDGQPFEAGPMSPGEVIGEAGAVAERATIAQFSAKTFCSPQV